ncbi:PHB depolymerase family esterase [Micromonospora sp. B11E3]|uniref:alpha/beta hydrolase family esterase n=1 Tax=Micromonospora sp. B11E3 TaxID=3153562 RepID=UPI00325EF956
MDRRPTRAATVRRTASAVAVAAALVLTVLIGCDVTRPPRRDAAVPTTPHATAPTASGPRSPVATGSSAHSITVAGRKRTFRLYRPARLPLSAPVPLVVMLHGALGNGRQAETAYGWDAVADREGFVVAYPDGLHRSWAVSAHCCGRPARDGVDDTAFIVATVADVSAKLPIDANRTYAAGISNGGMLAYRLACETTTFAAIGVVAGKLLGSCPSPAPISLIHVHGTADDVVPYDGRPGKLDNGGVGARPVKIDGGPVADQIARWREIARCAAPDVRTAGAVTTSTARCPGGRDVELITIADAGHQWPGASPAAVERLLGLDPPSTALAATDSIWRFFANHPRNS